MMITMMMKMMMVMIMMSNTRRGRMKRKRNTNLRTTSNNKRSMRGKRGYRNGVMEEKEDDEIRCMQRQRRGQSERHKTRLINMDGESE